MKSLTARLRRYSMTAVTFSLIALVLTAAKAEGWGDIGKPPFAALTVDSSHIAYADGSVLTSVGAYTTGGVTYSVPAALYDGNDNLCYSEGTVLYPDGSWEHFPTSTN
ncbi:MAG: hypothetical protein JWN14_4344 [Chthonomonadales bacterium]|nr:hypothetical protein [Chthonomonadales bacterium]